NKGYYKKNVTSTVITSVECGISSYLRLRDIPFVLFDLYESNEYQAIQKMYGDGKAQRSNVPFINHIDEGLYILNQIGASDTAKRAYCLHPIVQDDKGLMKHYYDFDYH